MKWRFRYTLVSSGLKEGCNRKTSWESSQAFLFHFLSFLLPSPLFRVPEGRRKEKYPQKWWYSAVKIKANCGTLFSRCREQLFKLMRTRLATRNLNPSLCLNGKLVASSPANSTFLCISSTPDTFLFFSAFSVIWNDDLLIRSLGSSSSMFVSSSNIFSNRLDFIVFTSTFSTCWHSLRFL